MPSWKSGHEMTKRRDFDSMILARKICYIHPIFKACFAQGTIGSTGHHVQTCSDNSSYENRFRRFLCEVAHYSCPNFCRFLAYVQCSIGGLDVDNLNGLKQQNRNKVYPKKTTRFWERGLRSSVLRNWSTPHPFSPHSLEYKCKSKTTQSLNYCRQK